MTRRTVEIESLAEFDARIGRTRSLNGWLLQSLDLTGRSRALAAVDPRGAVFLGCALTDDDAERLRRGGALLFPRLPDLPFDPYRATLYTPSELLGDERSLTYAQSPDAVIYGWARTRAAHGLAGTLATALHDQAIADALAETLADVRPERLVGVMGGHDLGRDEPGYADAVRLGARLAAAGRVLLTGGGPGAMEAANLGARLATATAAERAEAVGLLAAAPSYRSGIDGWLAPAREVLRRRPADGRLRSLGIPTWFYGHEPPNPFPDAVAKFFANPLREDTLLHRCRGGVVVLPGAAGTVQEIFTAATEDYYATDAGRLAPIVLVGRDHWEQRLPAWPLLARLAAGRPMDGWVHCVNTVDEAVGLLVD